MEKNYVTGSIFEEPSNDWVKRIFLDCDRNATHPNKISPTPAKSGQGGAFANLLVVTRLL